MKVNLSYDKAFYEIVEEVGNIEETIYQERKNIIKKNVKLLKSAVERNLPISKSDIKATNYDGTPYTHMRDDVRSSVKDDNQGLVSGVVRGGKNTGYKWHLLDNGTSNTPATHFIDKSLKEVELEFEGAIDMAIAKAVTRNRK